MIFVTVGTQQPFDRLIRGVDDWAASRERKDIFAQIGVTQYQPRNIRAVRFMSATEYRDAIASSDAIVAHAGMGSIITALEYGKPIIVMPKRNDLQETRGSHQIDTAKLFCSSRHIPVVHDNQQLFEALDGLRDIKRGNAIESTASLELLTAIREFITSA